MKINLKHIPRPFFQKEITARVRFFTYTNFH